MEYTPEEIEASRLRHENWIKAGGPAFPCSIDGMGNEGPDGISLRDWFAGQVAATCLDRIANSNDDPRRHGVGFVYETAAMMAYGMADAMLKVREDG